MRKLIFSSPLFFHLSGRFTEVFVNTLMFPYHSVSWWDRFNDLSANGFTKAKSLPHIELLMAISYAGQLEDYLATKEIYSKTIFYEDLEAEPRVEMSDVFDVMGLDKRYLDTALTALKKDSQKGTFVPFGAGKSISKQAQDACDRFFKDINLPISTGMSVSKIKSVFKK